MEINEQPKNIMLICVGNQNRSVYSEYYMQDKLKIRGYETIKISSAGVAVGVCLERQGRQFTTDLGEKADRLIAMDESVEYSLLNSFNQQKKKITTLHILDIYDQDIEGLVKELDKQLLPIINKYFPAR